AAEDVDVAFIELQGDFARSELAHLREAGIQALTERCEPEAVINEICVVDGELLLVVERGTVQGERFEFAQGANDQRAARRLIAAAAFHADETILHQIDAANGMLAADGVEGLDQLRATHALAVDGNGITLLK